MTPKRIDVAGYYALHVPAALLPIVAGLLLYGWEALATISVVLLSAVAALLVWRRIGWRGGLLNPYRCILLALILSLALPPHLLMPLNQETWPIVPAAGILLVMLTWLLGPLGSGRVQPVLASYVLLVIFFQPASLLTPHQVLKPTHVFLGNLFNNEPINANSTRTVPWIFSERDAPNRFDALYVPRTAAGSLSVYTSGRQQPDWSSVSLEMVLRDRMPPLENLAIGGEPGPIGASSAVAVILAGLLLIKRGLIDFRIPLLAVLAAYAAFLILPIPVVISETVTDWQWLAFRPHYLGWPVALTFANYELLASPFLFVLFFLAPSGQSQPMRRRGRAVYGLTFGLLAAPAQLYGSVAIGPYVALLLAGLTSVILDRLCTPKALV
jgi:Na+-translocating ferredoxin:NAD+ oxidoreductase RnfD subunit